jgi:hypothetical protein
MFQINHFKKIIGPCSVGCSIKTTQGREHNKIVPAQKSVHHYIYDMNRIKKIRCRKCLRVQSDFVEGLQSHIKH